MINLKYDQEQMDEFKDYVIGEAMRSALLSESNSWFAQLNGDLQLILKPTQKSWKNTSKIKMQRASGLFPVQSEIRWLYA